MVPLTLPTKMLSHQLPSRVVDINLKIETTVQEYYKHGKKVVNCWIEFIYQKKNCWIEFSLSQDILRYSTSECETNNN